MSSKDLLQVGNRRQPLKETSGEPNKSQRAAQQCSLDLIVFVMTLSQQFHVADTASLRGSHINGLWWTLQRFLRSPSSWYLMLMARAELGSLIVWRDRRQFFSAARFPFLVENVGLALVFACNSILKSVHHLESLLGS